jgi:glycosyltransferase involved in cell wall biosynthesis
MDEKKEVTMISIVICSRRPDLLAELRQNIAETIGNNHELVVIENSHNRYNIFQAYNEGVDRAKGDILCFMHDDVMMRTKGWGNKVTEVFEDDSIGMVGVAGSHFMPKAPMYWCSSPYIAQYNLQTDNGKTIVNDTPDAFVNGLADVVAVDGLFFCIPRRLFETLRFDDVHYKGFHAYDMDMSMQVQALGKRVCVTRGFLVEHFWSERQFQNKETMAQLDESMEVFFNKWIDALPMVKGINEPEMVIDRLNNLCVDAYDAKKARRSKAYRLGRTVLTPFRWLNGFKK